MNKIYKVIYSKVRQCYVVVSEIAKSHGRNTKSSVAKSSAVLTAAVLIALGSFSIEAALFPATADAAIIKTKTPGSDFVGVERTDGLFDDSVYANHNGQGAHGDNSITIGLKAVASDGTITIGDRDASTSLGSVYVGRGPGMPTGKTMPTTSDKGYWATSVGYQSDATGYGSIAIGSNATANNSYDKDSTGHGIQLRVPSGDGSITLNGKPDIQRASVAIGYGANADNGNIAIGSYSDASTDLRTATTTDGEEIKSYLTDTKADSYVSVGKTGALRRISNVADGAADSDVATIGQLKALSDKAGVYNKGWGIKIGDYTKKDAAGNETTVKNAISVDRNLGNNSTSVTQVSNTGLILGGDFSGTDQPDEQYGNYGATGQYAVTLGGKSNRASGESSVAAGGMDNTANGNQAFVGGGWQNTASGSLSSAIGGAKNTASGLQSSAFGGSQNTASGSESSAIGGDRNTASGPESSAIGGCENTASGDESSAIGGLKNIASGWKSSAFGGFDNISLSIGSSTLGGMDSVVLGDHATGIAGGSTGPSADNSLAAGSSSVVTVDNGTAIGYQATTNKDGTIAFGHDKGDISGYTVTWQQRTDKDSSGNIVKNADGTTNDYTKDPKSVTATTYTDSYYNRLVKVAEGQDDHDVVVVKQLKQYAQKDAGNIGNNIKVYKTDKNGNIQLGDDKNPSVDETATTKAKNDSKDAWGKALGAKTEDMSTSTAASNSDQLITGKTLYNYDKPNADGTNVKLNQTTGQNLSALDSQVAKNTTKLDDENHNIKYYSVKDKTPDDKLLPSIPGYLNDKNDGAKGAGSMAAGFNTHADGIASTVAGSYSGVINSKTDGLDLRGATALSYGTFNINQNTDATKAYSGVANSIIGQVNMTKNSNAAIIYGAGNIVTDSYRPIDEKKAAAILGSVNDPAQLGEAMKDAVESSGGQVMVMGGGNSVDKAYMTQVTGVGNKVNGKDSTYAEGTSTQYNFVDGFQNELTNGKHDYIIGSKNKVSGDSVDTNQSNIIFGDNHKLTNQQNNVIIGSSDTADDETTASNIVAIGHNAKVSAEGGVAIGSGSEASTAAGVTGYDPTTTDEKSTDTAAAWTSKKAAVSIGTADATRQINGVAAGTEDTDAVNVAQLKKLNGMKANVAADNIGSKLNGTDEEKTNNEKAWATAIGNGDIATPKGMLVTDTAVHNEVRPTQDGTYVKASNTTAANLTALDGQVGTNTTDITNLKDLSNITDNGKIVVKKLASGAVTVTQGDRVTVETTKDDTAGTTTYKISANNDGKVVAGDTNLVSGDTVNTAITNAINQAGTDTDTKLKGKADINAGNIGANLKNADGTAATDEQIKTNKDAWASAIGTTVVEKGNKQLVTSEAVATALDGKANKSDVYMKSETYNKTEVDNIVNGITSNVDGKANTDLGNINENGKKIIRDLAKDSVKVVAGKNTTVTEGTEGNAKTYAVNVEGNGQVASGNTGLISGDTLYKEVRADIDDTNSAYIKKDSTVGKNLSALDTGLKNTSALIHTNEKGDTIQIGGNSTATKIDVAGKDGKGRVITGIVSDANDPNSAANVGYVNGITAASNQQIYNDMNMQYNHVENDISRAAAGSNALAALHPMQEFDPDDKAQFALGYGHYRNSNAGAVGAFYQPDENSMVNFGVSFGNGDAGINAGVTFKFGPGGSGHHALTKTQMAKVIDAQSKEIDELKKDNADKDKRIDALEQKMTEILAKLDKSKD